MPDIQYIQHYEERIRKLVGALEEISLGHLGPLSTVSIARQAVDNDRYLSEKYLSDAGGD